MEQSQSSHTTDARDDTPVIDNRQSTDYNQRTNGTSSDQVQSEILKQLKELRSELNYMKKNNEKK